MHLMHLTWLAGHVIGFFHGPAVITCTVMTVLGFGLIFVFWKVFEKDFRDSGSD